MRAKTIWGVVVLLGLCLLLGLGGIAVEAKDVKAGPIWNDADALAKCPKVCARNGRIWAGKWRTTKRGQMSTCHCIHDEGGPKSGGVSISPNEYEAGPIWNNDDAGKKCPRVCDRVGSSWDGNWRTTKWGSMSVCSCGGRGGGNAGWRPQPPSGPTTSCSIPQNGGCRACSVSCPPGKQASCSGSETISYDPNVCWTQAQCRCE
jgi:hypothetical protein